MQASRKKAPRFRVGDRVKFPLGKYRVAGVVTEDRGLLGVQGIRLYRIRVPMDPYEPENFTVPENELEPVAKGDPMDRAPMKEEIIDYLKNGGLVSILMANSSGGRNQPRVWLCRDQLGNLTHTFSQDNGIVGGEVVPFWVLWENDRIFLPKKDQVIAFLSSFGLAPEEAEGVVESVGTVPEPRVGDRRHSR